MTMDRGMLADLFYRQLAKTSSDWEESADRVDHLRQVMNLLFVELTQRERFHFGTLFARMAYVAQRYALPGDLVFYLHHFRKASRATRSPSDEEQLAALGTKALMECVQRVTGQAPDPKLDLPIPKAWPIDLRPAEIRAFRRRVRVVAVGDDPEASQLLVREEDRPQEVVRVQYNIPDRNEQFADTVRLLRRVFGFPVSLNLIDVEIDRQGVLRPRALVVEPDFLVDVSAIAECMQPFGPEPLTHLLKKYLPFQMSAPILLGQVANYFLDELLGDPTLPFSALLARIFPMYPLHFCLFDDAKIRQLLGDARGHHQNLSRVVRVDLREAGIRSEKSQLEPTFYAEKYGLQGRLDLFHEDEDRLAIVELKSGKVFMPNKYGLAHNHYTQTLLYDLLIRSVGEESGRSTDPANYILYSRLDRDNLRYAPRTQAQQFEALQVRNKILALEACLCRLGLEDGDILREGDRLFGRLHPAKHPEARGFRRRDLRRFTEVLAGLDALERKFFYAFSGFIAREQRLAKVGGEGQGGRRGQAALWSNTFREKEEAFDLLRRLELVENHSGEPEPTLVFQKTAATNPLANFRTGDIALLYPFDDEHPRAALRHQVFKGTLIDLGPERLTFRLRSRQFNDRIFRRHRHWNLEPDLLDSSFTGLYRSLFDFAAASKSCRDLWLGRRPPRPPERELRVKGPGLSEEQAAILGRMIAANDYFLLWGPPGTGKTSIMLRHMVDHLYHQSQERILLLAYTNRAVDEICKALTRIGEGLDFLRIGSRFSTHPDFRPYLLRDQLGQVQNRRELRALITGHRIVVATVSSLANKPELFDLQGFDRLLIDEASQILEPALLGLLTRVPRCVLIGDHKQLPAVVVQSDAEAAVRDEALREIGLCHLGNALFERLYRRAVDQGWTWAFAQLRHQGRMHRDIMQFPSVHFYGNSLDILPEALPQHEKQRAGPPPLEAEADDLDRLLLGRRVVFLATPADRQGGGLKTNRFEAAWVVRIIQRFRKHFSRLGQSFRSDTLGVITPYRAQIAQIRRAMAEAGATDPHISVDTVERYQGSARDIIILSLCTNSFNQLRALISHSEEGVDRKLNVAMTRAREHLIVLGNPDLLGEDPVYADFMARYRSPIRLASE